MELITDDCSLFIEMRIIIIANGHFDHFKNDRAVMLLGDILIAADGGVRHLQKLGLTPNVLIGDLDSLSPAEEANLENAGTEIIRHPTDKDETDLELALLHALKLGADEILLFAALGERWDMTFANILLLADPRFARVNVRVFSEKEEMFVIHSGEREPFKANLAIRFPCSPSVGTRWASPYRV